MIVLTLGIYAPFYEMKREKFLLANSFAGNRHFDFDGDGGELMGHYLLSIFLALPTLGFSLLWYHVYKQRYIWNHTTFGKARFECLITFGGMLKVDLINLPSGPFHAGLRLSLGPGAVHQLSHPKPGPEGQRGPADPQTKGPKGERHG